MRKLILSVITVVFVLSISSIASSEPVYAPAVDEDEAVAEESVDTSGDKTARLISPSIYNHKLVIEGKLSIPYSYLGIFYSDEHGKSGKIFVSSERTSGSSTIKNPEVAQCMSSGSGSNGFKCTMSPKQVITFEGGSESILAGDFDSADKSQLYDLLQEVVIVVNIMEGDYLMTYNFYLDQLLEMDIVPTDPKEEDENVDDVDEDESDDLNQYSSLSGDDSMCSLNTTASFSVSGISSILAALALLIRRKNRS